MAAQPANLEDSHSKPPRPEVRPQARSRLLYLDNLRTVVITAVVLGHISGSYGVEADWVYREGGQSSDLVSGLGLMAMIDPPKEGVKEAIESFTEHQRVLMTKK